MTSRTAPCSDPDFSPDLASDGAFSEDDPFDSARLRGTRALGSGVGHVEPRPLENDPTGMEHLLDRAPTVGMAAQGAIGERLKDFELLAALLAAVLVGGHSAIYQGFRGTVVILTPGAFRQFRTPVDGPTRL